MQRLAGNVSGFSVDSQDRSNAAWQPVSRISLQHMHSNDGSALNHALRKKNFASQEEQENESAAMINHVSFMLLLIILRISIHTWLLLLPQGNFLLQVRDISSSQRKWWYIYWVTEHFNATLHNSTTRKQFKHDFDWETIRSDKPSPIIPSQQRGNKHVHVWIQVIHDQMGGFV